LKEHITGSVRLADTVFRLCEHAASQSVCTKKSDELSKELTAQVADLSTRLQSMDTLVTRISSRYDAISTTVQDVVTQNAALMAQLKALSKPTSGVPATPASVPHSRPTMMGGLTSYATKQVPPSASGRGGGLNGIVPTSATPALGRSGFRIPGEN
jgi:hypothetical protein